MFAWWGRTVYRYRYIVIGVMVALCLGGGVYGISLGSHVTQSGFYDEGSQSVARVVGRRQSLRTRPHQPRRRDPDAAGRQEGRRPGVDEEDRPASSTSSWPTILTRSKRWVGWLQAPRHHARDRAADEDGGSVEDVRQHPAQGRRRRLDPEELPGHRARPAEGQRRRTSSWPASTHWPANSPAPSAKTSSAPRWPPSRWCASCCSSCSAA